MEKQIKWAGVAMIVAALLMFTRMAPIFAVLPEDMAFPPESTWEMVRLAAIAGSRWQLSHVMGLLAVILFAVAYALHAHILIRSGWSRTGRILAATSVFAFGLFGIALVVDGFVVPQTIEGFLSVDTGSSISLEEVAESHQLALRFFTPGVFLVFATMGVFSSPMIHRRIYARWQGVLGQAIAVAAVTAYLAGLTGPAWNEMQIAGTLMMAAFAWHLLVGSSALVARSGSNRADKVPA